MPQKISKSNPIFQEIKSILKNNKTHDLVYIDDLSTLNLAVNYPLQIETFLYCDELEYKEDTKSLIDLLCKKAKQSFTISKSTFDSIKQKENSAGLIAIIKINLLKLEDMKSLNYLVVCDRLEIPGNLGTIYRTMDAAKVDGMILVDTVTKPTNSKLASSARGCNLLIPTANETYESTKNWLLDNNYTIFLGEPNLGSDYKSYDYSGKIAIVVGSERFGINPDWYNHKHEKVYIPMYGSNNSLNVGVAASILIYEATMNRQNKKEN